MFFGALLLASCGAVSTPETTCQIGKHTVFCSQNGCAAPRCCCCCLRSSLCASAVKCDGGCGIANYGAGVGPGHYRVFAPNYFEGAGARREPTDKQQQQQWKP